MTVQNTLRTPPRDITGFLFRKWAEAIALDVKNLGAVQEITPISQADADASNNTIYYSTTASKLVYKDSGGTVHNLY